MQKEIDTGRLIGPHFRTYADIRAYSRKYIVLTQFRATAWPGQPWSSPHIAKHKLSNIRLEASEASLHEAGGPQTIWA